MDTTEALYPALKKGPGRPRKLIVADEPKGSWGGTRPGAGRKKTGHQRKHSVSVYLDTDEMDKLKSLALENDLSVNGYITQLLSTVLE